VALALAVTLILGTGLLRPQLELMRAKHDAAQPRPCAPGQARDCVGGTMEAVIVAPRASAPR
jgi:hypothetical protein